MLLDTHATPAVSPTLAADMHVARLRAEGREVFHMGFGQAPFPVQGRIGRALTLHAGENGYLPVAGLPALREAAARSQGALCGLDANATDVLVGPGSKLILYAAQMAIPGDLLLPAPSWVSYAPQARMLGQQCTAVPVTVDDTGYHVAASALGETIHAARKAGRKPSKLLLNYPNNPTGMTMSDAALASLAEVCVAEDIAIISDEIYGRLAFDGEYRSIARHAPEHTIVTTGLSKHLSLGGWRLGIGLVPKAIGGLFETLVGLASETWSCVAAPVQHAAIEAYSGHDDVEQYVATSAEIHGRVTGYISARLEAMGVPCPQPQGGFYAWPTFPVAKLPADMRASSEALAAGLADQLGLVTLPGTAFGMPPEALNLRLSACDYDGAEALRAHAADPACPIASFAPRVEGAMDAVEALLAG